jgi:DNA polymerase-3 subunit gamma/tau
MNLYTKHRSQKFSEVVGQSHIVKVLTNAIINQRIGHAYLFSGPRGTGKTTIARLLSKSLNCEKRKDDDFEPCNTCQSCREIINGTSMDIIEIDAASNRGIDEIRELRDKIRFAPSGKHYKIFIIDEVHMLTREAFNALLKTLEEPPKHAIFILATTELNKVPDTIVSRSQQFNFYLHDLVDIKKQITSIAKKEKIDIDEKSIETISRAARGSIRDGITLLDQVSNASTKINDDLTREILGMVKIEVVYEFISLMRQQKVEKIVIFIKKLFDNGVNFEQFTREIVEYLHQILLYQYNCKEITNNHTQQEKNQFVEFQKSFSHRQTIKYIERFIQALNEIKDTNLPTLALEMAVFDLIGAGQIEVSDVENDNNVVASRVSKAVFDKKERSIHHKKQNSTQKKTINKVLSKKTRDDVDIGIDELKQKWSKIVDIISSNHSLKILLKNSAPVKIIKDTIYVGVEFDLYKKRLEQSKIYDNLCKALRKNLHKDCVIKFEVDQGLVKEVNCDSLDLKSSLESDVEDIFAS